MQNGEDDKMPRRGSHPLENTFDSDDLKEHSRNRSASFSDEIFSQLDGFRDRSGSSTDSSPSEESVHGETNPERDEELEFKQDREKAIHVLKSLHPNRVSPNKSGVW